MEHYFAAVKKWSKDTNSQSIVKFGVDGSGDTLAYYFHKRNIEDLVDWVNRIMYENLGNTQQDFSDLKGQNVWQILRH